MGKLRVLDGETFGRLTVVGLGEKTNSGGQKWRVRCECGTEKEVASNHLLRRHQPVRSCGCLRGDKVRARHSANETAFNLLLLSYKKNAKAKSRSFLLSVEEFARLTQSACHYCGQAPKTVICNKPKTGRYVHNGIDRVDPSLGYAAGNCVPCCKTCNYMKLAMSEADFLKHVVTIVRFQTEKHDA